MSLLRQGNFPIPTPLENLQREGQENLKIEELDDGEEDEELKIDDCDDLPTMSSAIINQLKRQRSELEETDQHSSSKKSKFSINDILDVNDETEDKKSNCETSM